MGCVVWGWIPICLLASGAFAADALSWGGMLDAVRGEKSLQPRCERLVKNAREDAQKPIIKRAMTLAEVGQNRTWLDGRANALEPEIRETFALAMSDFGACSSLAEELPLLAAAYRLTGKKLFLDRVVAQLQEMAAWSPLQRPGWTLYHPGARLPADGKDGNWLATGCGVRAIADTLELMPEDAIPNSLFERLRTLLRGEIDGVVDDWRTKRPWFVSSNNAITNQWVLPTEGLVRACLVLGVESYRDAYELGVGNLLQALNSHGPAGEFEEGFGYASFTVTSMLHAARAMAANGDRRAVDHAFLRNFPTWLVHHFQPADMIINCFDAGAARGGADRSRPLLSMLAACTRSPVARWALAAQTAGAADTIAGLAASALPPVGADAAPPLFAAYERATRVNWRNDWSTDGTGVWVRGGHPLDQHDHCDRGHVNFIARGKPILIEAGTPYYHHPLMGSQFASGVGHNLLQIGTEEPRVTNAGETLVLRGWQPVGVVAPISVRRLDASGGDVTVEVVGSYEGLNKWTRRVVWDSDLLSVEDAVSLSADCHEPLLFRWHLGTDDAVDLKGKGRKWEIKWPAARIALKASAPIIVTQEKLPDNTINDLGSDPATDPRHTCVVVKSEKPQQLFEIVTLVVAH
jgi:hypothetical protein